MTTYSVYHSGSLYGLGRSSGPHATYHKVQSAARDSVRTFGADQCISDDQDEYRQWHAFLAGSRVLVVPVEVLPPAPPDEPEPEPSAAQRTYQAAFVAAREPGRSKAASRRQRKAAREAVIRDHGSEWLDDHGNPRRTLA